MSISSTGLSHHELHGGKPITITVAMAKKLSGLGNTKIWGLIKEGRLKVVHVDRRTLIVFLSFEALLSPDASSDLKPRRRAPSPKVRAKQDQAGEV
jgi:hypothetical protein